MHFASIYEDLLNTFDNEVKYYTRIKWIKDAVYKDFHIRLLKREDILQLDKAVKKSFFIDKSDWLRSRMREAIKLAKKENGED